MSKTAWAGLTWLSSSVFFICSVGLPLQSCILPSISFFHACQRWERAAAIAGVMGRLSVALFFLFFPYARVVTLVPIFYFSFLQTIELPAVFFLGFWFFDQTS